MVSNGPKFLPFKKLMIENNEFNHLTEKNEWNLLTIVLTCTVGIQHMGLLAFFKWEFRTTCSNNMINYYFFFKAYSIRELWIILFFFLIVSASHCSTFLCFFSYQLLQNSSFPCYVFLLHNTLSFFSSFHINYY